MEIKKCTRVRENVNTCTMRVPASFFIHTGLPYDTRFKVFWNSENNELRLVPILEDEEKK